MYDESINFENKPHFIKRKKNAMSLYFIVYFFVLLHLTI